MKNNINFKEFYVKPKLPDNLKTLAKLAQNIWSTWDMDAYRLFTRINPLLFRKFNHNPVKLLQEVSEQRLNELAEDNGFLNELSSVYDKFDSYLRFKGSFSDAEGKKRSFSSDSVIAYFSMEYGLHESLPIYSGGLGILSGDHIKASSDLNLPLIGFGLLYRYGYFSQKIDAEGMQKEFYIENEWFSKPVQILKDESGNDLILSTNLRDERIYMKAWKIAVGSVPIYLLDTNINLNSEKNRTITDYLYVSDREMRLKQELILAYGSLELMSKLKIEPKIYHLNEGHSAFLIIKRLEKLINEREFNFSQAREIIYNTTAFTTHTPVPAGNEKFELNLVRAYLQQEIEKLGANTEEFLEYGKIEGSGDFWLPALAIRFAKYINGVSILHSKVSREMWHSIYPNLYEDEMPIIAVTNGVHVQSWLSRGITRLFDRYLGPNFRHMGEKKSIWENVLSIPDLEIWEAHKFRKEQMIGFIRDRLQKSVSFRSSRYGKSVRIQNILNNSFLTIGFARRFATYKRANLILRDEERLLKILRSKRTPVQFIFAGKAHPADEKGKKMIQDLINFARKHHIEDRFIFLENYDINIARHLVQGVDVWLNNPIKPLEASGTSGMKAGMNGVLNFSVGDGWWPECYNSQNGWEITAGENISDSDLRDTLESNEIYDLIENEIAPLYYSQDKNGVPIEWVQKMKHSIYDVGLGFNMHRMLRNYIDEFYVPGINSLNEIEQDDYKLLKEILDLKEKVTKFWDKVSFVDCKMNILDNDVIGNGETLKIEATIKAENAPSDLFRLELFYIYRNAKYKVIPFKFIKKENDMIHFRVEHQIIGAGKQNFNIRIKPKYCKYNNFNGYAKWYF